MQNVELPAELCIHGSLLKDNTKQQTIQTSSASSLLHTGIRQYESEQFAAAITSWTQALQNDQPPSDSLTQALLLSNLSLAHQHLGQWPQATETIAQSLSLLETPIDSAAYSETLAKALNTQGRLYWGQGNMEAALLSWREATTAYRQADHKRGVLLSLINQAKALQTLGLHVQSKTILNEEISQILQNGALDPVLTATGFWHLGNAQRQFGELTASQENLQQSLAIAKTANRPQIQSSVLLDLGNTERALSDSASAIGKKDEALVHQTAALAAYEEVASTGAASLNQVQANLNRLSFLIDLEEWSAAQALWPDLLSSIPQLPPSRTAIYAQLNFAKSLATLMQVSEAQPKEAQPKNIQISQAGTPSWQEIDAILVTAIQQAQALDDTIAESYGIGQRGELYEMLQQWPQAQALTQKALWLTNETQFLDGRYRWEWQQGRLLRKQGKQDEAVKAYDAAVKTLEQVRKNLLFIDAEVQFSFRDNVEPVYREFVELLLSHGEQASFSDQTLNLAIQQIDSLQLSELENFLRCDLASTTTISQFEADTDAAILYPIILPDRIAVILQLQGQKIFADFEIPQETAETKLEQLRRDLSNAPNRTPEVRKAAKEIYKWLFSETIEAALQDYEIQTLVFVLDGALRNIPMAVLNDGEQYLVEKYAIAIAPELELFTPRPLTKELRVFTGGVGTPQEIENRQFPAIEKLDAELDKISELFGPQPPLTNENFQREALQQQLSTGSFSGIHIKTHGVFSSDPEETFIVAHQKLIRGQELGDLIQSASVQGETPIELLVLSACSTATGDNRAILGLAGIAVQAGARSTVSTLWEAQDIPNTALMIRFYEELKQPGTSRAKALQNAQLALIAQGYRAPHLWATYVLVGNWR
ncbi:CHAT domain-containing protein [Leptothoe sp. LEGE 181152]|nr:CHAT domain-containing protein [Leptothoe sp. LEGE 181152]